MLRGGGDLASGVALRLQRAGLRVVITELAQPLVVRRLVSFAEAVYNGQTRVEEVLARRVETPVQALPVLDQGEIAVLVDPPADSRHYFQPLVLIDGRMAKRPSELDRQAAPLVIGLGPGFMAGQDCHAVVETQRGHLLGRVIWLGASQPDTGIPETVGERGQERVLRAPADGPLVAQAEIGDRLETGQVVAEVGGKMVKAPFDGVLRGLVHPGLVVWRGQKIGDVDPRNNPEYCRLVSDKALAVGGGVLEAILTYPELRRRLWER